MLSLTRELETGATLRSDRKNNIILTYADKAVIVLDRRFKTKHGWVSGVEMLPIVETANTARTLTKSIPVSVTLYHKQVGHPSEYGRDTIDGSFKRCETYRDDGSL